MAESTLVEATRLEESEQNFEAAVAVLQNLIRQDPGCVEAYVHLAADSGILGRYQDAERYARTALGIDPYSGRACYYLACALRSLGRLDEAYPLMQKALALVKAQAAKGTLAETAGIELPLTGWNQNVERDALALSMYMLLHPSALHPSKQKSEPVSATPAGIEMQRGAHNGFDLAIPAGMKLHHDVQNRFALIIPTAWLPSGIYKILDFIHGLFSSIVRDKAAYQLGCREEAFNFVISPLSPEPSLGETQYQFMVYAQSRQFTHLEFGKITIQGKEHVWARYQVQDRAGKRWNKKYMIVFGGIEFSITGTCNNADTFARREKAWDAIALSFRQLT